MEDQCATQDGRWGFRGIRRTASQTAAVAIQDIRVTRFASSRGTPSDHKIGRTLPIANSRTIGTCAVRACVGPGALRFETTKAATAATGNRKASRCMDRAKSKLHAKRAARSTAATAPRNHTHRMRVTLICAIHSASRVGRFRVRFRERNSHASHSRWRLAAAKPDRFEPG